MKPLPKDGAAALQARLAQAGISLSPAECDSVAGLADWLHQGLAGLAVEASEPAAGEMAPIAAADALLDQDLFAQGRALRDGRLSAVALTRAYLARIAARDGAYRAFYTVTEKRALAGWPARPMHPGGKRPWPSATRWSSPGSPRPVPS